MLKAIRARRIISMAREKAAVGKDLLKPMESPIEDGVILVANGIIEDIGPYRSIRLPAGCSFTDLGDATLIPAPINAHCHLLLAHMAGKTLWGHGFAAWLKSLIPLILAQRKHADQAEIEAACQNACLDAARGAGHIGDIGGSMPGSLGMVHKRARNAGLGISHFCECFGFGPASPWPEASLAEISVIPDCAPAGHALYSTSPEILVSARKYCRQRNLVFSMHLAESLEENEQLQNGGGPLYDLYKDCVLPPNWRPPKMRPAALAHKLGLFGPGFLAVHGVWLNEDEMAALASSKSALCLCPRSNAALAVGRPDISALVRKGPLLCLGTDGLTSNTDVNVINEARYLSGELPEAALLRLLTVNGAKALGLEHAGRLARGYPANFRIWEAMV